MISSWRHIDLALGVQRIRSFIKRVTDSNRGLNILIDLFKLWSLRTCGEVKYKIWPGTVQTIWQSDYLERRSGPWLEPCPRSRAVRDTSLLITAEIRRSKLTHRCTKLYLGMSGAIECSSTWPEPGRWRAISISIWFVFIMTKLGRCQTAAIKLSLGWPRRFWRLWCENIAE